MGAWRDDTVQRIRELVAAAAPGAVEEAKWVKPTNPAGVPTWSKDGLICTCETYKDKVKVTFADGAALDDPTGLFNASLDGKVRRAIDIPVGGEVDAEAFVALVRAAAAHNGARAVARSKAPR